MESIQIYTKLLFILLIGDFHPEDWRFLKIWGCKSLKFGIFGNLFFFIPGIGNFQKSWNFYLGNWEFLKTWGCETPGLGVFRNLGILIPADWGFLSRGLGLFTTWGFLSGVLEIF